METKKVVPLKAQDEEPTNGTVSIAKPGGFDLNRFKSKRSGMAGVDPLPGVLPVHRASEAKDFIRLHPDDEAYWSPGLCFVSVPIKGQKHDTLHLIEEDLALEFLPEARVTRQLLVLASKPFDIFFLCTVPTQNLDGTWNASNLQGCLEAKDRWVMLVSRKAEGVDAYGVKRARSEDAFAEPKWPTQSLSEIIEVTFAGRMIDRDDHPSLLRLVGAKQSVS